MTTALLLLAFLTAGPSCPASAAQSAKQHYGAIEYGAAIAAVADVEQCFDGTAEELAEALRWRAEAKASSGDKAGALEAFGLLSVILPGYAMDPFESPKFRDLFAQGKAKAVSSKRAFGRLLRGEPGHATVQVFDPGGRVQSVWVTFDGAHVPATLQKDGLYDVNVPHGAQHANVVLESGDATVFRSSELAVRTLAPTAPESSAPEPVVTKPQPEPASSSSRLPIILGVAGGAVVVAVVAGIIAGVATSNSHVDGSLGRLQLPLESGSTR
jgi:hypothetical protein